MAINGGGSDVDGGAPLPLLPLAGPPSSVPASVEQLLGPTDTGVRPTRFVRRHLDEHAAPQPQLQAGYAANLPPLPKRPRKYFQVGAGFCVLFWEG